MAGALAVGYGTLGLFFRPFDKGCSLVVDSLRACGGSCPTEGFVSHMERGAVRGSGCWSSWERMGMFLVRCEGRERGVCLLVVSE